MTAATYFDSRHERMAQASEAGSWEIAYRQQVALLESLIHPGMTVLDVGCGPSLPYCTRGASMIGLDPSIASLARNDDLDERLHATATAIPLPERSVDLAVAFYALHHMTTQTIGGSEIRASNALREMARVLRPGGELLAFEMRPHWWAYLSERLLWDSAKALLGDRLDACFWRDDLYRDTLGDGVSVQTFHCSPFALFPPTFALPNLKLPRFLYPFTPVLYRWTKE